MPNTSARLPGRPRRCLDAPAAPARRDPWLPPEDPPGRGGADGVRRSVVAAAIGHVH
ncbi:hypothetical protein [Streptomyces jumonjinensis]|uniref:hypothetical protein n=1 Tax=Streptomyces jumonjinensis TaxID=1945 RepID=UPI0037AD2BF3